MPDTPVHAEQCNHEFLRSISEWPDGGLPEPTHYAPCGSHSILIRFDEHDTQFEYDGEWWVECDRCYIVHKLHCTRAMWETARDTLG